jgi:ribose transport system substrate-binding protein
MSMTARLLGPLLAVVCFCSGCNKAVHSTGSATGEQYFLITVNTQIPYWQTAASGFAKAASEMRVQGTVAGPGNYDAKAEQQEFRRVVQLNPAGILISPADPDLLKSDIDAAITAGIPVITVDADSSGSKRLSFIGTDNYEAGRMGGEIVSRSLQGNGAVAIFTMPGQTNLNERYRGYMEILSAYPHITVLPIVDIKGDPQIAFDQTQKLVAGKTKVSAFVCLDALGGKGVAKALDSAQVQGKTVIAMDSDPETLEWIRKGYIQGTIVQRPFTMGFFGLKMLEDLHRHKPRSLNGGWGRDPFAPVPSFVNTGVIWIDKQNLEAFTRTFATPPPGKQPE